MLAQSEEWGRVSSSGLVPDTQQIVVGTTCQITAITGPLQTTDFLSVCEIRADVVRCNTHIVLVYGTAATATAQSK